MEEQKKENFIGSSWSGKENLSLSDLKEFIESSSSYQKKPAIKMEDELAKREELKNKDLEQDIQLKKTTLDTLLNFLKVESIIIFAFALFQATGFLGFDLEEWSFRILVGATITQIYFMLRIAVEYLFPKNKQ